ncbi:MAG: MerR family transcriptional regulator [bacterium]
MINTDKRYRIGDVARSLELKVHVVRYWETEFKNFIHPQKSSGGHNLYSTKDIDIFTSIKKLLHSEGYNITGAKKKLKELQTVANDSNSKTVPRELLFIIREELNDIRKDLKKLNNDIIK